MGVFSGRKITAALRSKELLPTDLFKDPVDGAWKPLKRFASKKQVLPGKSSSRKRSQAAESISTINKSTLPPEEKAARIKGIKDDLQQLLGQ